MPEKFRTSATPYLCVGNAAEAIPFYERAFGAEEILRLPDDAGKITHAEISIGGAKVMLSDEFPEIGVVCPHSLGGSPVMVVLEVENVDAIFERAVDAGASVVRPLEDGFGGALRTGKVNDPFGHRWMILCRRG